MNPNSQSQIELAVDMRSPCCAGKVERALQEIEGIKKVNVDPAKQKVIIEGDVVAETVKNIIEKKTGMFAVVMGLGSSSNKSLGAAVSAIAVGDSCVRGLLRMNQTDPDTCIIEGNLDGLPNSENLYVSLHESGDLTNGCYSCGPPYSSGNTSTEDCVGIITHLKPDKDKGVQFRCTSSKLNVVDMYGLSMVVHDGSLQQIKDNKSNRLACGIVARSSGMYQNSKRFCACDGVNIWEEKKRSEGISTN